MPTSPNGVPVTRSELKAELAAVVKELRGYIDERSDNLRDNLRDYIDERTDNLRDNLRDYIDERTRDLQTEVLRAFGDYQQTQTTRFRHMKADLGNLNIATDERLAALEDRVLTIEKRLLGHNPQ